MGAMLLEPVARPGQSQCTDPIRAWHTHRVAVTSAEPESEPASLSSDSVGQDPLK